MIFVIGSIPNPNFLKNTTPNMIALYNTMKSGKKLGPAAGSSLNHYLRNKDIGLWTRLYKHLFLY